MQACRNGRPSSSSWPPIKPPRCLPSSAPQRCIAGRSSTSRASSGQDGALRARLGDALANAGRGADAARAYLEAVAHSNVADALELRRRAAMQFLISGHIDEGLATLQSVLATADMKLPRTPLRSLVSLLWRRARLRLRRLGFRERDPSEIAAADLTRIDVCWSAAVGLSVVDTIRGADFQARGLLLSLEAGEPSRIARSLAMEAAHSASTGGSNRKASAQLLEKADDLAHRVEDAYALAMVTLGRGVAAYLEGRWQDAQRALRPCGDDLPRPVHRRRLGARHRQRLRPVGLEPPGRGGRAQPPLADSAGAGTRARRSLRGDESQYLPHVGGAARGGRPGHGACRAARDHGPVVARGLPRPAQRCPLGGCADRALLRGRPIGLGADPPVLAGLATFASSPGPVHPDVDVLSPGPRGACGRGGAEELTPGRSSLAPGRRRERARKLEREGMPCPGAYAQMIRGALAAFGGDAPRAAILLADAVERFEAVNMQLCAAAVRRRLGELVGGDRGQAEVARADRWMDRSKDPESSRHDIHDLGETELRMNKL